MNLYKKFMDWRRDNQINSFSENTFIKDAPDDRFLFTKVALIFDIAGACYSDELRDLAINNVQDLEKALLGTIPNTKTHISRSFTINQ
ncbi:hypothetical protein NQ315_015243 [Exocentrus adspersus]|uniref:Uncharacterized protein n=1 Tax=Exocentrus adspersus TaxID=1586481 RepID=A0AAV8V7B2_9CUCU|nr:hypothetical protein NQ315_015243 [Exocentrus adspersus]